MITYKFSYKIINDYKLAVLSDNPVTLLDFLAFASLSGLLGSFSTPGLLFSEYKISLTGSDIYLSKVTQQDGSTVLFLKSFTTDHGSEKASNPYEATSLLNRFLGLVISKIDQNLSQ